MSGEENRATARRLFGDLNLVGKTPSERDSQKARDIINSFLHAWKTSKVIPNYHRTDDNSGSGRLQQRNLKKLASSNEDLPRLAAFNKNVFNSRRNKLDKQSLFALENSLDPKPIKRRRKKPDETEAKTYFGGEQVDDDDDEVSPEMKLASLISKPIYHNMRGSSVHRDSDQDYKEFMFGNNNNNDNEEDVGDNDIGLPSDDWRAGRSSIPATSPRSTVRYLAVEDDGDSDNVKLGQNRNFAIINAEQLERIIRNARNKIPSASELINRNMVERMLEESGEKKELISAPSYNSLPLPVSDAVRGSETDRKFYKYLPHLLESENFYSDEKVSPTEFKLEKKRLWGNIEKRYRRNRINNRPQDIAYVKRSLMDNLGETGNSFDAYGSIGQDTAQAAMKIAADAADNRQLPCSKQAATTTQFAGNRALSSGLIGGNGGLSDAVIGSNEAGGDIGGRNLGSLLDVSQFRQDMSKPRGENGIIQIAPEMSQKRSSLHNIVHALRRKRAATNVMKKKILQDSAQKKDEKLRTLKKQSIASVASSAASSRSLPARYFGGLPDSRGIENNDGIVEDNEVDSLEEKLAHDSTPLVMKIAQHDGQNLHKFWNNKHSPGNGYYTDLFEVMINNYLLGHGEGPNHAFLGDYFGHGPDEMERDDGVKSLESSPSTEDHHTASLIDAIWGHDLGDDQLGEHHIERQHSGPKIKSYFGGHHAGGILLPTETMDGIESHWMDHREHGSDFDHNDGHHADYPPSRIKAIQAIQDDPSIDVELNEHDNMGIGTPMPGGQHHHEHSFHNNGHSSFGGINLAPVIGDPVQVEDSHEDEYKQHIDNLLSQYHGLEERLRGTGGTLSGHLNQATFGHHGSHHLHTGYDLYAYKNPWDSMRIPYHVPVINHPSGDEEQAPPPAPIPFGGKTDEKGAPMIEGGKEEGGKGGPLVESSKATSNKESKGKGETEKNAKGSENKDPMPVIPKQRGGPEVSSGKNSTTEDGKERNTSKEEMKQTTEIKDTSDSKVGTDKDVRGGDTKSDAREDNDKSDGKKPKSIKSSAKNSDSKNTENKDSSEPNAVEMVQNIMSSSGKQSEMLSNLKAALGDQAENPKSLTALQLARLKQLSTMQQALLSSLAKQALKQGTKESDLKLDEKTAEATGSIDLKQLFELQNLQQLGAGIKTSSLVNALRHNSLLHTLKAAQQDMLRNAKSKAAATKESASLYSAKNGEKQAEDLRKAQTAADIQGFFGKLPVNRLTSDLGDVGSEKVSSKARPLTSTSESSITDSDVTVSELIKQLEQAQAKKSATNALKQAGMKGIKPALGKLLSESLIASLKKRQSHHSKPHRSVTTNTADNNHNNNNAGIDASSIPAYSSIGNEGPVPATVEENGKTRTTHVTPGSKKKLKSQQGKLRYEKESTETGTEKADIISHDNNDDIDDEKLNEINLSKKNVVKASKS
eukprot:gene17974-19770_t